MTILYMLLAAALLLLLVVVAILVKMAGKNENSQLADIRFNMTTLAGEVGRIEAAVKTEISVNRVEASTTNRDAREELTKACNALANN
ncbi:hypothetical protein [Paraflavitalea speifideaquila]|uniref:hypothetical protein n=1 Tax=Paraflavitalea speifideaquila TaxID=3076558 RepID=UPI0028F0995C|nr:hypothetical protein [Paraflavitalea speifideiaquila]